MNLYENVSYSIVGDKVKKVAIIFGGMSSEHDVSIHSAHFVYNNIDKTIYNLHKIYIDKQNNWYTYKGNIEDLIHKKKIRKKKIKNVISYLKTFDIVFPVMHGKYGEDGTMQGFLELFGIPYVGCTCMMSAIGIDKDMCKRVLNVSKIKQVPYILFNSDSDDLETILSKVSYPVIIKPATGGSSIGIHLANHKEELLDAIKQASLYDHKILIEKHIHMRELECAVIGGNPIKVSTVGEIKTKHAFYDYEAKYIDNSSEIMIPADIPHHLQIKIQEYAKKAFLSLGNKGFARVDFFYDIDTKKIYLNEINTIPGFTESSMFPKLFMYDGISYTNLITELIENSVGKL